MRNYWKVKYHVNWETSFVYLCDFSEWVFINIFFTKHLPSIQGFILQFKLKSSCFCFNCHYVMVTIFIWVGTVQQTGNRWLISNLILIMYLIWTNISKIIISTCNQYKIWYSNFLQWSSKSIMYFIFRKFYWRIVVLQCYASFYCTTKWISYMFTDNPSFLDSLLIKVTTED